MNSTAWDDYVHNPQQLSYGILSIFSIPEWILFSAMYTATFVNVIRRPERNAKVADGEKNDKVRESLPETSRLLAFFMIVIFFVIRGIYAMFFYLAVPDGDIPFVIKFLQRVFLYAIAIWWMLILCGPAVCGVISWMIYGVGNVRLEPKTQMEEFAQIICILPVYNEEAGLLIRGIESILDSNYPKDKIALHVSFDDDKKSELYASVLKHFGKNMSINNAKITEFFQLENGTKMYFHRWTHGGKRNTQKMTWDYIQENYMKSILDESILVLTDSDNFMLDEALNNLSVKLNDNPKKIAYAGYMSCMSKTEKWYQFNFIRFMQDTEYVSSEINRFFELAMGTVNCLPGGFTAIRYSAMEKVAQHYFADLPQETTTQYHQNYLGEDRYLTHLVHKTFPAYSIGFCPNARCKTDPPDTVEKYIKQRRRWLLGSVANEAYMLCTPALWRKFPILLTYKVIQTAWRSTTFCQLIIAISAVFEMTHSVGKSELLIYLISVGSPLTLAWLCACLAGIALHRYKICFVWPFMLIGQTVLQVFIDLYAVFTWKRRTWGGPRTTS